MAPLSRSASGSIRPVRDRPRQSNPNAPQRSHFRSADSRRFHAGADSQALVNGYRGRFYNAQDLIDELYASLADHSTTRVLKRLAAYDLLVLDELGYMNLKPEHANALFQLLEQRYARKSTLITTNLDFEHWYGLFRNKPLVDALLDRLQHHCIVLRLAGPSLRAPVPSPDSPAS